MSPLESFSPIIESTIHDGPTGSCSNTDGEKLFRVAWQTVRRLLDQLRSADPSKTSYPETAVNFLLAVMVLRQIVDAEARGEAADEAYFLSFSTNVHPTFLPSLFDKLGSTEIDLSMPALLSHMCSKPQA